MKTVYLRWGSVPVLYNNLTSECKDSLRHLRTSLLQFLPFSSAIAHFLTREPAVWRHKNANLPAAVNHCQICMLILCFTSTRIWIYMYIDTLLITVGVTCVIKHWSNNIARNVITCTVVLIVGGLCQTCSVHKGNVERHGEMTNACQTLVGSCKDKEFTWEDNMKMGSRQTKGIRVLTGLDSSSGRFNRRLLWTWENLGV